ncbi:MAG: hypothetical protein U0167_09790 [bacterium]
MAEPGNDRDREWRRLAERLPREIEPSSDLWRGLEARIRFEEASPWTATRRAPARPLLAAAAVALVLGGSFLLVRFGPHRDLAPVVAQQGPSAPAPHVAAAPTEDEWAAASDDVLKALEQSHGTLDPAAREVVRQNLQIIDDAVRKIHKALEDDPSSPYLQRLLTAEYQRRSALLRKAATGAI